MMKMKVIIQAHKMMVTMLKIRQMYMVNHKNSREKVLENHSEIELINIVMIDKKVILKEKLNKLLKLRILTNLKTKAILTVQLI